MHYATGLKIQSNRKYGYKILSIFFIIILYLLKNCYRNYQIINLYP